jgi:hypothetical protein
MSMALEMASLHSTDSGCSQAANVFPESVNHCEDEMVTANDVSVHGIGQGHCMLGAMFLSKFKMHMPVSQIQS